jgi:hypothetical protein
MKQINLLPKPRQEEIHYQSVLRGLYIIIAISIASFALVLFAQFGIKFYLGIEYKDTEYQIAQIKTQVDKKENSQIKDQISEINGKISDYKNLADSAPKWSKVLKAFSVLPPEGVKINSMSVDFRSKSIIINGFAPTRELVIAMYESVKKDTGHFNNIDYPLENVIKPKDIHFHFSFYINDSLLK